ncbi:prepilin-type N-terminal cleavage/methylation domain-containing protein [Candidatus Margulisiibacteriota bacterium]
MQIRLNKRGFTLIEIAASLMIFAAITLVALGILSHSTRSSTNSFEYIKLNLLIKEKLEIIKSLGFWVWDSFDTENLSGNTKEPAYIWKDNLSQISCNQRGLIEAVFLKDVAGELQDFAGEFDGNLARDKVRVSVSLYTSRGHPLSQSIVLSMYASHDKVKSLLGIIRKALEMYAEDNSGNYPNSGNLAVLVDDSYIPELPNDPYTTEKTKITHKEEETDWYYDNTANTITLEPNSHRGNADFRETWTY